MVKYAVGKHLAGEKLLKNPKDTPATLVKTLRHSEGMDGMTLDESSHIVTTILQ